MKNIRHCTICRKQAISLLLIAALLCALLLSGCAGAAKPASTPMPTATPVQTPQPGSTEPSAGGDLRIAMPYQPGTLHPLRANTVELVSLLSLIYETPVVVEEDGKVTPSLFESWSAAEDGNGYIFKLREGVKWHGQELTLTAQDIVYTLDKIREYSRTASGCLYSYCLEEIASYAAEEGDALGVRIVPKNGLVSLLYCLDFPVLSAQNAASEILIGTGPYQYKSYEATKQMQLVRNENWWKRAPYIDSITAVCVSDQERALEMLRNGELDAVYTTHLNAGSYKTAGSVAIGEVISRKYDCVLMNFRDSRLAQLEIRQAISYAINRDELISKVFAKHAVAADFPMVPSSYLNDIKYSETGVDLKQARTLLEQRGYSDRDGDGFVENAAGVSLAFDLLVLKQQDVSTYQDIGRSIREQLEKIGIRINLVEANAKSYLSALQQADFDLAVVSSYLSEKPALSAFLDSQGSLNYGRYSNYEMDRLLQAVSAASAAEIENAVDRVHKKFAEELVHISLCFESHSFLYSSRLQNVVGLDEPQLYAKINEWYINDEVSY